MGYDLINTTKTKKMSIANVFEQIKTNVEADPSLVDKIKGIYQFKIGDETWTVDLKNAPGSVTSGANGKPDVTITMKSEDFMDMVNGKINGQAAFMQGKLKIAGNMAYAMKLGTLFESKAGGAGGNAAASSPVDQIFEAIKAGIKEDPDLVKKVNGVYHFKLDGDSWVVDLKTPPGSVSKGAPSGKADCTLSLSKDDFVAMSTGELDGQSAFMQGKLKIAGNMALAMKLGQVMNAKKQSKL